MCGCWSLRSTGLEFYTENFSVSQIEESFSSVSSLQDLGTNGVLFCGLDWFCRDAVLSKCQRYLLKVINANFPGTQNMSNFP